MTFGTRTVKGASGIGPLPMPTDDGASDWMDRFSRRDQEWIADRFTHANGMQSAFRHGLSNLLEYGYKYSDLKRAYQHAKTGQMAMDNLVKIGDRHLAVASEKEAAGLTESAVEFYLRAALCLIRSSWSVLDPDHPDKAHRHGRAIEAYDKVIELHPAYEMEKVEITLPFHDETMPAVFHLTGDDNAPTILHLPGMDMAKEQSPNVLHNRFVDRGMNILTIDGPGQGEARIRGITDATNQTYQQAGRAAIDWLVDRPEVDASRIGVYGTSMGSYFGPRVAIEDDRVAALGLIKGTWYGKDIIFEQAPPSFKKRYMYMSGHTDEAAFDEFAERMTIDGLEDEIDAATFIGHGEYDELMPRSAAKRLYERLDTPKHLQLYENEFHPIGGADVMNELVDWFTRVWRGEIGADHAVAEYRPDYPTGSYVPSPTFDFLDQPHKPADIE